MLIRQAVICLSILLSIATGETAVAQCTVMAGNRCLDGQATSANPPKNKTHFSQRLEEQLCVGIVLALPDGYFYVPDLCGFKGQVSKELLRVCQVGVKCAVAVQAKQCAGVKAGCMEVVKIRSIKRI